MNIKNILTCAVSAVIFAAPSYGDFLFDFFIYHFKHRPGIEGIDINGLHAAMDGISRNANLDQDCVESQFTQFDFTTSGAPPSCSVINFTLEPAEGNTLLTVTVSNSPTEVIRQHFEFYFIVYSYQPYRRFAETRS